MIHTLDISCAGYSIKADWYEGAKADRVLLILQGFRSSRSRQLDFATYTVENTSASALVIDYSGHGDSPFDIKETRPAQHVLEVMYAYEWIVQNYPNAKISVIGNSYGSFLASHLVRYKNVEDLVLRAPAIYDPNAFYDLWSVRMADEDAYRKSIEEYRTNVTKLETNSLLNRSVVSPKRILVVVHENDEIIPHQTSDVFIQKFNADSFVASGFSHAVSQSDVTKEQVVHYQKRIVDWLNKI